MTKAKSVGDDGQKSQPKRTSKSAASDGTANRRSKNSYVRRRESEKPALTVRPTMKRTSTDNGMTNRRAMSTRNLMMAVSDPRNASTQRNLSSRDRLRRATKSQRHLLGPPRKEDKASLPEKETETLIDKKEMLGGIFGGRGVNRNTSGDQSRQPESDTDFIGTPIAEEDSDSEKGEFAEVLGDSSHQQVGEMTEKQVEKFIRTVAEKAKSAKNLNDLEAIVMGALRCNETKSMHDTCSSMGSDMADYEDDEDNEGSVIMKESEKSVLSTADIVSGTRKYVNMFLKAHMKDHSENRRWSNIAKPIADKVDETVKAENQKEDKHRSHNPACNAKLEETSITEKLPKAKLSKPRMTMVDVSEKNEIARAAAKALDQSKSKRTSSSSLSTSTSPSNKIDFSRVVATIENQAAVAKEKALSVRARAKMEAK